MTNMKLPNTFSVFPVLGKKPLVDWGTYSTRYPTKEEMETWKLKYPKNEWGIATGPISKVLVVDDDGGLDLSKYPMPRTLTQRTPRGGSHYFLKWISELDTKVTTKTNIFNVDLEITKAVDVRGSGGFAVFYGFNQPYWAVPLALPPKWLIDLLPRKDANRSIVGILGNLEGIKHGNRNDSFTRLAGSLRARGYTIEEMYQFLESKAKEVEFPLSELETICRSVGRYEPKISDLHTDNAASIDEFLRETEVVEWIVPGLIAKKSIGFVAGLPETGKTWALIDLAVECAKGGGLWLNKFPVKGAKVLFIDQERFKGETQRRFRSVLSAKALNGAMLKENLFIRCGTTTRLDLQHSYEAFRKEVSEIRPDICIVDSFATFHNSEENNRKDVQAVLERIKSLRTEFGCTFLFIHHENKYAFNKDGDQEPSISQMAGSVAIPAACETVLTVRKHDNDSSMIYHTKSTLASTVPPFLMKIVDMNEAKTSIKVEGY